MTDRPALEAALVLADELIALLPRQGNHWDKIVRYEAARTSAAKEQVGSCSAHPDGCSGQSTSCVREKDRMPSVAAFKRAAYLLDRDGNRETAIRVLLEAAQALERAPRAAIQGDPEPDRRLH